MLLRKNRTNFGTRRPGLHRPPPLAAVTEITPPDETCADGF